MGIEGWDIDIEDRDVVARNPGFRLEWVVLHDVWLASVRWAVVIDMVKRVDVRWSVGMDTPC